MNMLSCRCLNILPRLFLVIGTAFSLFACNAAKAGSVESQPSFQLAVLRDWVAFQPPGLGYTTATSWPILKAAYPSEVVFNITEDDVETYNWTEQKIILTKKSSLVFLEALDCEENQQSFTCILLNSFVVALDEVPVYGGQFILPASQAAIRFPVIYVSIVDDNVILDIRPIHAFGGIEETEPGWAVIKDQRIEQIFAHLNKLTR